MAVVLYLTRLHTSGIKLQQPNTGLDRDVRDDFVDYQAATLWYLRLSAVGFCFV